MIEHFFALWGTNSPNIAQIWAALDFVWVSLEVNDWSPTNEKLTKFYSHPYWLLNELFIETDPESMCHRTKFMNWPASKRPSRVVDIGGAYGTLGRMISSN